ncbi:MAG TPA: hypothetical protein VE573_00250 [Nitrososphaeraceae archaeon]|nr:hypothetical protein [Nitrososphaeraceae archaeon]
MATMNDVLWIVSVILWTTGVTTIILFIMKRRGTTNQKGSGVK